MIANLAEERRHAFEALTNGAHSNFALISPFIDGSPGTEPDDDLRSPPVSPVSGMTMTGRHSRVA